jgi:hypothetical protein
MACFAIITRKSREQASNNVSPTTNVDEWRVLRSSHANLGNKQAITFLQPQMLMNGVFCDYHTQIWQAAASCRGAKNLCVRNTELREFEVATEIQFYQILSFFHLVNTWTGQKYQIPYRVMPK